MYTVYVKTIQWTNSTYFRPCEVEQSLRNTNVYMWLGKDCKYASWKDVCGDTIMLKFAGVVYILEKASLRRC